MAYAAGAGAAAVAAAAAMANAIKASGAIVEVEPELFMAILAREKDRRPLVIMAQGGIIKPNYRYLTACRGFIFYTKSANALMLSGYVDVITARKIWTPS
ncbi:MAG: hypothetical protein R6V59_00075 [Dehalococcoidia bacterium]